MGSTPTYDVAVIGGGASGLAAALSATRAGARAVVLEHDVEAGLSLLATGNGRCNISNAHLDPTRYRHPDIARAVMGEAPEQRLADFFDSLGIMIAQEDEGRLYPHSRRAESVRDALLAACEREGVEVRCGVEVTGAQTPDGEGDIWKLSVEEPERALRTKAGRDRKASLRAARKALAETPRMARSLLARSVIIAVGGSSCAIAKLFALPHLDEVPALCPVACTPASPLSPRLLESLDGLRVAAALRLAHEDGTGYREEGEVLFRPQGISGIAAFNLSRRLHENDRLELDLFPGSDEASLAAFLTRQERTTGGRTPEALVGLLAPQLRASLADAWNNSSSENAAHLFKRLPLTVTGTFGEQQAQVRRGGIPFSDIDLVTLRLPHSASALFACGEALDMDADCGGFNLAWAWASGLRAGAAAAAHASQTPSVDLPAR